MKVSIQPSIAKGQMQAPPSKSMAHRYLICAGLANGESVISNIDLSQDVLATLDCLHALGVKTEYENRTLKIKGTDICRVKESAELLCRECGSTIRFFVPICLMTGQNMKLYGSETLLKRPMTIYENICKDQNLMYKITDKYLEVEGNLKSGDYKIPGDISSQFISGLLFVLPLLSEDSKIIITPPFESRSYVNMTINALNEFGIKIEWINDYELFIKGNQKYLNKTLTVEGDYSNAAFFEALNLIGGDVNVTGLIEDSLQGDKVYLSYFEKLKQENSVLDISDCPDLGPILITMAAMLNGAKFTGTRRLKIKESDRGQAIAQELRKLSAEIKLEDNEIIVKKKELKKTLEVLSGHNDHRIVMSLAVALTRIGGVIEGTNAVNKSFPDFFSRLEELGIGVSYEKLDN